MIEEKVYGTRDHWSTGQTEVALALLMLEQEEDLQRAYELLFHAYATYQEQLGPGHPLTQQLGGFLQPLIERARGQGES